MRLRSGQIHLFSCDVINWQYLSSAEARFGVDRTTLAVAA